MIVQEKVYEASVKWVGDRPLTFAEFLEMFGPKDWVELIDGAVVEKRMVQLDHEKLLHWTEFPLSRGWEPVRRARLRQQVADLEAANLLPIERHGQLLIRAVLLPLAVAGARRGPLGSVYTSKRRSGRLAIQYTGMPARA